MVEKRSYDRLVARIEALARRVSELCRRQDKTLQHWLDNEEVCLLLNIQKRTLQRYRERGLLPCTQIRHKVYYKTTDVERLLASAAHRCGASRKTGRLWTSNRFSNGRTSGDAAPDAGADGAGSGPLHRGAPSDAGRRTLPDGPRVSERLKISRRTLQEYRSSGEIPYYCVCGKVLYRESDIERVLEEHYFALP